MEQTETNSEDRDDGDRPRIDGQSHSDHDVERRQDAAEPAPEVNFGERASIQRNVFHMMSSQALTWTLGMVAAVIVPRFLGPSALGQVNVAVAIWDVGFVLVGLGMTRSIQLEIAKNPDRSASLLSTAFVVRSIGFVLVSLGIGAYTVIAGTSRVLTVLIAIFAVSTLVKLWAETYGILFLGLERMAITARIVTSTKLVNTISMVAVVVIGGGVYAVAAVALASNLFGWVVSARASRRIVRIPLRGWRTHVGWLTATSMPFLFAQLANTLYRQVDVLVIARLAGPTEVGWYGTADLLVGSLLFPATVIIASVFPAFGRLSDDRPAFDALVHRTYSVLLLCAVPIALGTMLIGPEFAPLLYGEEFRGTGQVLVVFGPVIVLTFATTLFGSLALATGKGTTWSVVLLVATAITIALDIVLVPWASDRFDNGAIGGALAYIVTEGLQFTIGVALVARFAVTRQALWRSVRILLAGALMFAAGWPLREMVFVVPVLVCVPVYVLAVIALRAVGPDERQMIARLAQRLRRRRTT